jgi:folate-binding protein YgfZ
MVPEAGREINAEEFPAELGLDALAVSFHKGCYLGQEIISRIESVGKVKRALKLVETQVPLLQGVPVENSLGEEGLTTRPTLPLGEKSHLGLALFRTSMVSPQMTSNQAVVAFPKSGSKKS